VVVNNVICSADTCRQKYVNQLKDSKVQTRKEKVKAIPLQAWTGPEVSKRLRFPDFKTIGT